MFVMPACFNAGDTVYFPFDTYDSNGASVTITGLAVTDIEVYKNGSVTQRSSDNGYALLDTDGIDFDGTTGLHGFSIDTSDNSDAGFWADGAQYWVNINAITVDSQTVRFTYLLTLGFLLRPTTAGRKLDVSAGGEAGIDWANVGTPGSTVSLSATTINLVTTATNLTNAPTSGDLTATMKASVNAEVVDVVSVDARVAGKTIEDALEIVGAVVSGVITTAGTATEIFKDFGGTNKVTVTVDASGNRSAIVYAA